MNAVARGGSEKFDERQHQAMYDVARSRLAALIAAHTWTYWQLLEPYVAERPELVMEPPDGFNDDDVRNVHRTLQWLREKMGADLRWWQDAKLLVTADALSFVTTDLLERLGIADAFDEQPAPLEQVSQAKGRAVRRIAGIAERLADAGDVDRAFAIDAQVDAFYSNEMPVYKPHLDVFVRPDGVTMMGASLAPVRDEFAWLVDLLRPDAVKVNEYGTPTEDSPDDPIKYRWGLITNVGPNPSVAWDQRFAAGSWLRNIFDTAKRELPIMFGIEPPSNHESESPER